MNHLSRRISFPVLLTALLLSVFVLSDATVMAAGKTKLIVPKKETCYEIGENGTETFSYSAQYTYDKKGNVTKETTKYPDETVVYTYKRNKQGEVKSLVTQSNGTNSTKETTKYKKKKRVSGKSYVWNATAGAWQTSGSCTYKSTKKKLETWQYDAAKALEYHHIEKYNKKGLVTSLRTYDAAGKTTNLEDSTYDKKGNLKHATYIQIDPETGYQNTTNVYYKYNKKGLVTRIQYISTDTEGGSYNSTDTYKYSKFYKKNKAYPRQTLIYEDGKLARRIVTSYKVIK